MDIEWLPVLYYFILQGKEEQPKVLGGVIAPMLREQRPGKRVIFGMQTSQQVTSPLETKKEFIALLVPKFSLVSPCQATNIHILKY